MSSLFRLLGFRVGCIDILSTKDSLGTISRFFIVLSDKQILREENMVVASHPIL